MISGLKVFFCSTKSFIILNVKDESTYARLRGTMLRLGYRDYVEARLQGTMLRLGYRVLC